MSQLMQPAGPTFDVGPRVDRRLESARRIQVQRNMTTAPVHIEREGAIATLVFNRPEQLNALDLPSAQAFAAACASLARDAGVRVVVLRGEGRCFGAGGDLQGFSGADPAEFARRWWQAYHLQDADDAHVLVCAVPYILSALAVLRAVHARRHVGRWWGVALAAAIVPAAGVGAAFGTAVTAELWPSLLAAATIAGSLLLVRAYPQGTRGYPTPAPR